MDTVKSLLKRNAKVEHWLRQLRLHLIKYYRRFANVLSYRETPKSNASLSRIERGPHIDIPPNTEARDFINTTNCRTIAEIGVYTGGTSELFAQHLNGEGELHLFDYEDHVNEVKAKLNAAGYSNVYAHGNSRRPLDSYSWSLMRVLQEHPNPIYDYVFLDGAHTWTIDALAFLLIDRLLKVGGFVQFDDYYWTIELGLENDRPEVKEWYTKEQRRVPHVRLIVDLLVKRDPRYTEVVPNKIYKKIRS